MIKKIGFIGLGKMGTPITRHLLEAGYLVRGYDLVRERVTGLARDGFHCADSAADAAEGVEVVFTMVMRPEDVTAALFGKRGALESATPGTIVVDMSTMPVTFQLHRFEELSRRGFKPFEAPVGGSVPHAEAGTLKVMAAGGEALFAELRPVLQTFGKPVYLGQAGLGTTMKLVHNLIIGVNLAALLEGLLLGEKAGLEVAQMLDILLESGAYSRLIEFKNELLRSREFVTRAQGTTELLTKDLGSALESGKALGVPLPHTALALQDLVSSIALGNKDKDYSVLLEVLEARAGLRGV